MQARAETAVLLIVCPDRKGLVARVATLLYEHDANIIHADQHQDPEAGLFFMRVEWELDGFDLASFGSAFEPLASDLKMDWRLSRSPDRVRLGIMVSWQLHCLADLLERHRAGELVCDISVVVSNHPDAAGLTRFYGVRFEHTPTEGRARSDVEEQQLNILRGAGVEAIALARYMQILTPAFVARFPDRIINVHHSFLPAFVGARPYDRAHERGVKLIGSTSHYVTADLDEGPIIEQDVVRISHRDQVRDLIEKGRDLERIVLSRAVKWHLDRRILRYRNKTVVFD